MSEFFAGLSNNHGNYTQDLPLAILYSRLQRVDRKDVMALRHEGDTVFPRFGWLGGCARERYVTKTSHLYGSNDKG